MPKKIHHTKGVHLVISKNKLPIKDAFYFDAPDHRMIFAIPKLDYVYIGTTDTLFNNDLDKPNTTSKDIDYMLNALNIQFPDLTIKPNDITSCWAGIRSLIQSNENKPNEISRKEELFTDVNGLISITGGKLTGYRLMAEKVVDLVLKSSNHSTNSCPTKNLPFSGSHWEGCPSVDRLIEIADSKFDEVKQTGISPHDFKLLFYRYGTNIDILIEKAYEFMNKERNPELLWIKTEVWYAVHFEMVETLGSFFIYRTELILFATEKVKKHKQFVANELANWLAWDETEKEKQIKQFENDQRYYLPNYKQ